MRFNRITFIFTAVYFIFIGGSAYYNLVPPVRLFHHAFVTLLFAFWFYRRARTTGLPATPLDRPLAAAFAVWIITAIISIDPRMAFEHLWFILLHVAIFYVLVDLFQRGRHRMVIEAQFLLGALIVMITGMEILSWYFGLGILPGTEIGWVNVIGPEAWLPLRPIRVALAMNISTLLAGYVAPLITVSVGWALTARRTDYRQALWLLAALLFVVLTLTASRGGLLSAGTGLFILSVLRAIQHPQLIRRISPAMIVAGLVAITIPAALALSTPRGMGDVGRIDLYESAIKITADYPLVGVGPGLYGRALREYRTLPRDHMASAHNAPLNTLSETGLLGAAVSVWLAVALLRAWRRTWQAQRTDARRLRIEACIGALVGVGVHSMVDVFTTTPVVSVIMLIAAYSITGYRSPLDERPSGNRWAAGVALAITLAYGIFFVQTDRALIAYYRSLSGDMELAQSAASLDPHLALYDLHIAILLGNDAADNPDDAALRQAAISAYEHALEREPTWDTGWINLAALYEQRGDFVTALQHLGRAVTIRESDSALIHRARIAEQHELRSEQAILDDYVNGIERGGYHLPLSIFWQETPLRQQAVMLFAAKAAPVPQYLTLAAVAPEQTAALVPAVPSTAEEWWVAGEHALTVQDDPEMAVERFTNAVRRARTNGDLYASRARARLQTDPESARRDLDIALLLRTRYENPDAIRTQLPTDSQALNLYRARAVPARTVEQHFAAVLYGGRAAIFDLLPQMRPPGPGTEALRPWYELAEAHRINGRIDSARTVYEAILDLAPEETEARTYLEALPGGND